MPFVEVFTRERLSDEIRAKLAEELSNTIMTVEVGGPTESAKMIDWMCEVLGIAFKNTCSDQTFFLAVSLLDRYI